MDENKTFVELALEELQKNDLEEYGQEIILEEYLARELDIDLDTVTEKEKNVLTKNFVHLMCTVIDDLRSIDKRLSEYRERYEFLKNDRSNAAEFKRRKIQYFCDINKNARSEILDFVTNGIKQYLLDNPFDTLARVEEDDKLAVLFLQRRYKYAFYRSFYDMDYDYGACVKISELHNDAPMNKWMEIEHEYLEIKKTDTEEFKNKLKRIVEEKDIISEILNRVSGNYHLKRREEIFETLSELFRAKKYQSFIALGLIQLEGLFYDYCQIKYGEKENQGTLVEKVDKALKSNEYKYMKFYPYFAFDVPIMRNDVAHKGFVDVKDLEWTAYELVLDLNTVSKMVRSESYDKFIVFSMTHEAMLKWTPEDNDEENGNLSMYRMLIKELFGIRYVIGEHFWELLKCPEKYDEELNFYSQEDLPEGYTDIAGIVIVLSALVRQENFWIAIKETLQQYSNDTTQWDEFIEFAKKMRNDYIADLDEDAKTHCIELGKLISG